ncbi:bifunctional 4-hydroxy-2-oxoglutarate aldolase/2-dehydro-3-deoxy-phosphogluconate aldolase [Rhodopila sp.]|jgi:2-dehydro-3-deoxyphosphogluconate aldolase/(4S)-4-hydroxy-2-oxoglutarate aldolase|uniref:bifunctional 4-hydroxy-2-oxoglutarate aldolase/2-dehydro-3-deoxy-phosphogluconate aldolase n=1 Tax=Rhodopila sp. TaxID=2480087 RepID=UPI0039B73C90
MLRLAPVIPVLSIEDRAQAVPLAKALVAGGLRVLEVTLRTEAGLEAIRAITAEVADAVVGVGTVLAPDQYEAATRAGARFAVSPGASSRLLDAARNPHVPLLPGIATPSEAMALLDRGYRFGKFFPAEPCGGVAWLAAVAAPLPGLSFCPTGGINLESAPRYLALPNVICVGGSWMVGRAAVEAGDWAAITTAATAAARLRQV